MADERHDSDPYPDLTTLVADLRTGVRELALKLPEDIHRAHREDVERALAGIAAVAIRGESATSLFATRDILREIEEACRG